MSLIRVGGMALLAYLPLLLIGVVSYGRVGVNSQTDGAAALRRVADSGALFSITKALFHLGALLLVPAGIGLFFYFAPTTEPVVRPSVEESNP